MLWIKSLHLIAVVFWFAGLLYLPRLFVYHADCREAEGRALFAAMERRLYWRIMLPAMLATLFLGVALMGYGVSGKWLMAKLLLVVALLAFHASLFFFMKKLEAPAHPSARFFRFYNEVPAMLLIPIVILALVKPF